MAVVGAIVAGLFVLGQAILADSVIGSKHDLTIAPYNLPGTSCMYCHTSHMDPTGSGSAPLWDRTTTMQTFTLYSGLDLQGTISQPDPDGITRLCMSCHDGTIALDNHGSDTTVMTGVNLVGTTLANDHPVSITYTTTTASNDGFLYDPATTTITGEISGLTGTIQNDMLFNDKVECASCHDVHNNANTKFLRIANPNSELCMTCHMY